MPLKPLRMACKLVQSFSVMVGTSTTATAEDITTTTTMITTDILTEAGIVVVGPQADMMAEDTRVADTTGGEAAEGKAATAAEEEGFAN
jgi:hypothetical protein